MNTPTIQKHSPSITPAAAGLAVLGLGVAIAQTALAAEASCALSSGKTLTPVIELYTSEGCSSCPPADQWLSTLKGKPVVAQAFHVGYWDYIGWVDRFANPAYTSRQREVASTNHLSSIYTPQMVRNGRDSHEYSKAWESTTPARAAIKLQRVGTTDAFEAQVTPDSGVANWSAYWTVTEHGHSSKVKAGENSGEFLKHDFVVRQYTPVGNYSGAQTLRLATIAGSADHARQVNLVVSDPKTGEPLQALSLQCSN